VKRVFADTSFYIALVRPEDENHRASLDFDRHFDGQYITSEFVLIELALQRCRRSTSGGCRGNTSI
jgi:predicted nucleic acid-binding protein